MAQFVFEGDVTALTARQQQFIIEILEKRGYSGNKVIIEAIGKAGDNFGANVKRIILKINDGKTFKMIAKIGPTNEMVRAMTAVLFINESIIYEEVLPKFADLQKSEKINTEELLQFTECYGILTEEPNELILLEDLQLLNFEMLDKFSSLSNETIKLVLKNLAIYHSLSLVLKTKNPASFEDSCKKFVDFMTHTYSSPMIGPFLESLETNALAVLEDDKYKNAVRNMLIQLPKMTPKVLKDQSVARHSVILQGDVWTNNLMFRMQDNHPLECIMIDYQQSRLSNPVFDVLSLIFNCTDHKTRIEHYSNWIDYYHLALEKSLFSYGIKIDYIYPRDQLDADLKRYSKFIFSLSLLAIVMTTMSSEDASKMKDVMESFDQDATKTFVSVMNERKMESMVFMKKKLEGLIDSCREFGYIK